LGGKKEERVKIRKKKVKHIPGGNRSLVGDQSSLRMELLGGFGLEALLESRGGEDTDIERRHRSRRQRRERGA